MLQPSYVYSTKVNQLVGSMVETSPFLIAVDSTVRDQYIANGVGTAFDLGPGGQDLSKLLASKTAAILLSFTGSTPITLDLTALAAATGVTVAGATSFASWSHMLFTAITGPVAISPGASNPIRNQLGGTSPTHTLQTGDVAHWQNSTPLVVDSTHKTITFTPTSGGSMTVWLGGA